MEDQEVKFVEALEKWFETQLYVREVIARSGPTAIKTQDERRKMANEELVAALKEWVFLLEEK